MPSLEDLKNYSFGPSEVERLICSQHALADLELLQHRDPNSWNVEFSPLRALARPAGSARPIHVCIATEEIVGPVRNGGIGTTYAYLSEMLGVLGIECTILYLRGQEVENGTIDQWIEHYAAKGVRFVPVPNYAAADRLQTGADRWLQAPYNMLRYLLDHHVDVVHVSEWRGSAYLSLLAKRQGLAFSKTLFIVKTSSPWLWNRLYGSQPVERVEDLTKIFAERKSVELADMVVGGSTHLLRWMSSQGYRLPAGRTFVQPNVVFFDHLKEILAERSNVPGTRVSIDEIVFFGRLEARKGIFLFCEAIKRLIDYGIRLPPKISFMGKPGARLTARPDQDILDYIADVTSNWPCKVEVHTEFQQIEALRYLLGGARLAVMPSVIENSSLAVYEATMCGIPFVASSSGGTPELIAEADRPIVLCEAHPVPLADKIRTALEFGGYVSTPSFDNEQNLEEWRDFHKSLGAGLLEDLLVRNAAETFPLNNAEVTACVYHCKEVDALLRTLASLVAQVTKPSRVLVALDLTMAEARVAREAGAQFDLAIDFLDCANFDAGLSFNMMARSATSDHLLFLWSGTILREEALQALNRTMLSSGAEVVNFFHRVVSPNSEDAGYLNASILGSITEAFFRSDLSPMPVLASRTAFQAVGGFSTDYRVLGCEQEFVSHCQVQGVACTTALMEMGSVEAWDPAWIRARCYDEPVSYFRAIRPQMAAAPLALRDMMLLSKGLQAKTVKKPGVRKAAPSSPLAKKRTNTAFSQLFAMLDATDVDRKQIAAKGVVKEPSGKVDTVVIDLPEPKKADGNAKGKSPVKVVRREVAPKKVEPEQAVAPERRKELEYVTVLRNQLHRLPSAPHERFTGRLLGVHKTTFYGWVCDENRMDQPVMVECLRDGKMVTTVKADMDLDSAIPIPKDLRGHAFRVTIAMPLLWHGALRRPVEISLRIAGSSATLAVIKVGDRNLRAAGYDGHCEIVRPGIINGWAWKVDDPETNIDVALFVDGHFLLRTPCIRERDDLKAAGVGFGNYGFEVAIPKILRDGQRRVISAVIADAGLELKSGRLVLQGNSLQAL